MLILFALRFNVHKIKTEQTGHNGTFCRFSQNVILLRMQSLAASGSWKWSASFLLGRDSSTMSSMDANSCRSVFPENTITRLLSLVLVIFTKEPCLRNTLLTQPYFYHSHFFCPRETLKIHFIIRKPSKWHHQWGQQPHSEIQMFIWIPLLKQSLT